MQYILIIGSLEAPDGFDDGFQLAMVAGFFVGLGIILIFTVGGTLGNVVGAVVILALVYWYVGTDVKKQAA